MERENLVKLLQENESWVMKNVYGAVEMYSTFESYETIYMYIDVETLEIYAEIADSAIAANLYELIKQGRLVKFYEFGVGGFSDLGCKEAEYIEYLREAHFRYDLTLETIIENI